MTFSDFFGETEHFSAKNGALRWSILVGKQKHNVQKPTVISVRAPARSTAVNYVFSPSIRFNLLTHVL